MALKVVHVDWSILARGMQDVKVRFIKNSDLLMIRYIHISL